MSEYAWQLTHADYCALSDEDRHAITPTNGGALPHHSNFWGVEVQSAIQSGMAVPLAVLESIDASGGSLASHLRWAAKGFDLDPVVRTWTEKEIAV